MGFEFAIFDYPRLTQERKRKEGINILKEKSRLTEHVSANV